MSIATDGSDPFAASCTSIYPFFSLMTAHHEHRWKVGREWTDEDGRLLRQRTCEGCDLEQQLRFVPKDMTWKLFRQSDLKKGPSHRRAS